MLWPGPVGCFREDHIKQFYARWPVLGAEVFLFHKAQTQRETLGNELWEGVCPPRLRGLTVTGPLWQSFPIWVFQPACLEMTHPWAEMSTPWLSGGGWVQR